MTTIKQQLINAIADGNFLKVARRIHIKNRDDREKIGEIVADIHNNGKIDVIAEFRKLNRADQQHDFFMTRHVLEYALPSINASVTAVMDCVKHLVEQAENDMAAGTLIPPFIGFCEANAERADEVLSVALADIDDTFDFITPAIVAGSHLRLEQYANKAIELSSNENVKIRSRSVHALGRITYHDRKDLIAKSLQEIQTAVEQGYDEHLYVAALRSIISLYNADNSREEFVVNLMKHILHEPTDNVVCEASQLLSFEAKRLPANMIDLLLKALGRVKQDHNETIKNIDFGLCSLIEHGICENVIFFLEELLAHGEQNFSISQFETLSYSIRDNNKFLNILITRWLFSKRIALGSAAAKLLEKTSEYGISVAADLDQLHKLPEGILVFMARKVCGWFFQKPISAASFIVSLFDPASDDEVQEMTDILFNPLLISYPGCVKDYLVDIEKKLSEKARQSIRAALAHLDDHQKNLKSTGRIDELLPSQAQREAFHRYQNRLFTESYNEHQKNSIFSLITTKMYLLYGNSSIYHIHNSTKQANRQEMKLAEHSHFFEIPTLEHIDPHGLDYMLRVFRIEGCES